MTSVQLSAGTLDVEDSGGAGPVVVMLHGLLMDSSLWQDVSDILAPDFRCIAPTLPLGAHRTPFGPDADLTLPGVAGLVMELIERMGLEDVTLVGNDTGGALVQLLAGDKTPGVGRIVLVSCDAFDNFPPGWTGRVLVTAAKLPPVLFGLFMQQLRVKPIRRSPVAFGWLTKRGDPSTKRWITSLLADRRVRRDTVRVLRGVAAAPDLLDDAARGLRNFDGAALVVWAAEDRVMPLAHGRRLAALLPDSRLIEIDDSYTLIPLDQPADLAQTLRDFISHAATRSGVE